MNGILVINKPEGYTSRDIVNIVGGKLGTKKIGHTGTLDPKARGILILGIGSALKMNELMDNYDKEYIAEGILGIATDTLDMDSNATVLEKRNVNIDKEAIIKVVNSFKGRYMQEVPKYSAVKVNGKKLYEYARNNIPVELPSKEVEIKEIELIDEIAYKDGKIYFKIRCVVSKGTFIRALIRDIGKELGVPAVMNSLVRTKIGNFSIDDSYTLDDIEKDNYELVDIRSAFSQIKSVTVDDELTLKIRNGVILDKFFDDEMAFVVDKDNNLLALYRNDKNKSRPYKMFI